MSAQELRRDAWPELPSGARIAVIGAGWYGCHVARELIAAGLDVTVFEAAEQPFAYASGRNQNRLHQGFHYPRSHVTRDQSIRGFHRFMETYPHLSSPVPRNYFGIVSGRSLLDYETYLQIIRAAGLAFTEVPVEDSGLVGVSGVVNCEERVIETERAAAWFAEELQGPLRTGARVSSLREDEHGVLVDSERFDAAVACTWGTFQPPAAWDIFYEPCLTLLYEADADIPAVTLMDGPFFSLFPYRGRTFTLTSVSFTPLGTYPDYAHAAERLRTMSTAEIGALREAMEQQAIRPLPDFRRHLRPAGHNLSMKTKLRDATYARPALVYGDGRLLHVFSGKIDAVFEASDEVQHRLTRALVATAGRAAI